METNILDELINETGYPCISIILPGENDKGKYLSSLNKTILEVETLLEKVSLSERDRIILNHTLENMISSPNLVSGEGVGIYVSPAKHELVHFPFPVNKKFVIDQHFETEDLLILKEFSEEAENAL